MQNEIQEKINKLRELGKEESELKLWEGLLPNLTEQEAAELSKSLDEEIQLITG